MPPLLPHPNPPAPRTKPLHRNEPYSGGGLDSVFRYGARDWVFVFGSGRRGSLSSSPSTTGEAINQRVLKETLPPLSGAAPAVRRRKRHEAPQHRDEPPA
ncbi:hypothetical protein MTO96_019157 [Rhipicephalus appendiculatus]